MATINTKERIVLASIKLFNENGMANVRLQQIADETGISVGNLAYHFKNKDAIIEAVCDYAWLQVKDMLANIKTEPSFQDFEDLIEMYFQLVKDLPHLYFDMAEFGRNYSGFYARFTGLIGKFINNLFQFLKYNGETGLLRSAVHHGQYWHLATVLWMEVSFWPQQRIIAGKAIDDFPAFRHMIWDTILPFLSEEGQEIYEGLPVA